MEKKISFSGLKKVLSPKEMKNVTGGSGGGSCQVQCSDNQIHDICCSDISDCIDECWSVCGDGGWSTNCY